MHEIQVCEEKKINCIFTQTDPKRTNPVNLNQFLFSKIGKTKQNRTNEDFIGSDIF